MFETIEESDLPASMADLTGLFAGVSAEDMNHSVFAIGDVQIRLLWIVREHGGPYGAVLASRLRVKNKLFDEFARFRKNLDPIRAAVADINQPVFRDVDTDDDACTYGVSQRAELFGGRC